MRDPDWTAESVRDVHCARGVDVSMRVSLFLSFKFSGRMLSMHLDCSRTYVPKKYYFAYHLRPPLFFSGGSFFGLYSPNFSVPRI